MATQRTFFTRLQDITRYSVDFYRQRFGQLLIFSIPALVAFFIPWLVPAPTFIALGLQELRTGSLPDLTLTDVAVAGAAYLVSLFLIADAVANINLLIKTRRTFTASSQEVWSAITTYALRITYVYTVLVLVFALLNLLTFEVLDAGAQAVIYPLSVLVLSVLFFFVAPAIVIDDAPVHHAIGYSLRLALQRPGLVAAWVVIGFLLLSGVRLVTSVVPGFAGILTLAVNALFILPFLIVLQTQMYVEKYPLAH